MPFFVQLKLSLLIFRNLIVRASLGRFAFFAMAADTVLGLFADWKVRARLGLATLAAPFHLSFSCSPASTEYQMAVRQPVTIIGHNVSGQLIRL